MSTSVVSVRGRDRSELLADPDFVYVGRLYSPRGNRGGCRWPATIWGNPFKPGMSKSAARTWVGQVGGIFHMPTLGGRATLGIDDALLLYELVIQDALHQVQLARTCSDIVVSPQLRALARACQASAA